LRNGNVNTEKYINDVHLLVGEGICHSVTLPYKRRNFVEKWREKNPIFLYTSLVNDPKGRYQKK